MKTKFPLLLSVVLVAAVMFLARDSRPADPGPTTNPLPDHLKKDAKLYSIIQHPETLTAEIGTFAAFAVRVYPEANATYQWRFQKSTNQITSIDNQTQTNSIILTNDIPGSTNRELVLTSASTNHVGAYSVVVSWPNAQSVTSSNVFLSVYEVHGTNSTYGTLTKSALEFAAPTGSETTCPSSSNPTWTFNKIHVPADSSGAVYSFYGPGVAISSQSGPFVNSGRNKYLKIDTVSPLNASSRTMVRLWKSFFNPTDNGEADCETGNSAILPIMEYYEMPSTDNVLQARYRLSIYYNTPAPNGGNVIMHWLYFD